MPHALVIRITKIHEDVFVHKNSALLGKIAHKEVPLSMFGILAARSQFLKNTRVGPFNLIL